MKKFKVLAMFLATILMIGVLTACGGTTEEETTAEETTVEETTAEETTEARVVDYTQQKVATVTLGFGDIEATAKANDDISEFNVTFVAFEEDQELSGTVQDGKFSVEYDKTGFFGEDAQAIYDGVMAGSAAWEPIQ